MKGVSPLDLKTLHGLEASLKDWASAANNETFAEL
tara:strand:+ start:260 stop:364 length:105 start_codon:yes stop_codon:yes gene_type:complete